MAHSWDYFWSGHATDPHEYLSSQLLKNMELHLDWVGTLERFNEKLSVFCSVGIQFVNSRKNQAIGFKKITQNEMNKTTISFIEGKLLEDKLL